MKLLLITLGLAYTLVSFAEQDTETKEPTPTEITTSEKKTDDTSKLQSAAETTNVTSQDNIKGSVPRAQFTSGIKNREPIDNLDSQRNTRHKIYFFTELLGFEGQQIKHRWIYKDEVKAELSFKVAGERWRVYSSKNLMPDWVGIWTVQVMDESGSVIASKSMNYNLEEQPVTP